MSLPPSSGYASAEIGEVTGYIPVRWIHILTAVTKRLIDIDDDLLDRARVALGAESISATVRQALERVSQADPGASYLDALATLSDLDPAERSAAWRTGER